MSKELWLEFGYKHDDGWQDVLWYNEGRAAEWKYFVKHLLKRVFRRKPNSRQYFKVRYGKKGFTFTV